jgi:DNA-binding MarR family transcriptional regulator
MIEREETEGMTGGEGLLRPARSDDAPAWLIQRTARLLRVLFLRLMQDEAADLTPEMWTVLTRLVARDGQYQSELAEATYRDRPNISRILSGMEQRGLVARRADPEDRRKTRIHITSRAREIVASTAPMAARTRDRLYEGLERQELETLRRGLRQIESNTLVLLSELESEAPPG